MLSDKEKLRVKNNMHLLNGNTYRFDKASNCITYKEWKFNKLKRLIKTAIEDTRLFNDFEAFSDVEVLNIVRTYNTKLTNYFDAVKEMQRRNISL